MRKNRTFIGIATALGLQALATLAFAAGPVETSVYAMQGVAVDVTATDAATAKQMALVEVQMIAFRQLADKQGSARLSDDVSKFEAKDVMPYLKSMSIEEESVSPGRYAGKFTIRFLPAKIKTLYEKYGIALPDDQGPPLLIIPIWTENGTASLWDDNPWRQAWQNLRAEQSSVPVIVPLGDSEDQKALSAADLATKDEVKLEAIRRRYDVKSVLIAEATPSALGQGIAVKIEGESPIGRVRIEKTYGTDTPSMHDAATQAVNRFHALMTDKYRRDTEKLAAAKAEDEANRKPSSMPVAVPFSSPSQWNGLRARILATPGVVGVDVSSLDGEGAVIQLLFRGPVQNLVESFSSAGLALSQIGQTWIIQSG